MGVDEGLAARRPESSNNSKAYFLCDSRMPFEDRATSKPKKYFNSPRSLIRNREWRDSLILVISEISFPVSTTSSTYIKSAVKEE